jgi:photosystem II stability/assembly factor-like uncharacterized protein
MATGTKYIFAGAAHHTASGGERHRGGLFRCTPGEGRWEALAAGLPQEVEARAFAIDPRAPDTTLYVGTQDGVYRSRDAGSHWQRLGFRERGVVIWSLAVDPTDPNVLYAGSAPAAVYRSDDGGESWRKLANAKSPGHCEMGFPVRTIRIAIDPSRPQDVYAALEVSGVIRSDDGGETWTDLSAPLIRLADENPQLKSRIGSDRDSEGMLDSHAIVVSRAAPGTPILAVRMGLFRGDDRGAGWTDMQVGRHSPLTYCRDVAVSPHDPRSLFACLSPASRSHDGMLYRSGDLGASWQRIDHGVKAEATMMSVSQAASDPKRIYCASRCGQVFGTEDGAESWREYRLPPSVQDVYAVACL